MVYLLPQLPYSYDALEPFLDEQTLRVHHQGHHRKYVENLNAILSNYPDCQKPLEELLASLHTLPIDIQTSVANNAGGHANHTLFWSVLSAPSTKIADSSELMTELESIFGNLPTFQKKFSTIAESHFSNGWVWLCAGGEEELSIISTKDHESPVSLGLTPLLTLDVWEHAYYLKYKNDRSPYIDGFWKVVNWEEVGLRWNEFKKRGSTSREWRLAS